MAIFLSGPTLRRAVGRLLNADHPRLAVAFWGAGATRTLFRGRSHGEARIICDVTMGGSNPAELEILGAPTNTNLRHLPGLHAKVYLSSRGLVVGSANASSHGLGFGPQAPHVEAAISHAATDPVHDEAVAWFEATWERSTQVDGAALLVARETWGRRPPPARRRTRDPASLLDAVATKPGRFRGVGFAFTLAGSTSEERDEAVRAAVADDDASKVRLLSRATRAEMADWSVEDVFSGWAQADAWAWPQRFVSAHRNGRGGVGYWFYERRHVAIVDGISGTVFAARRRHLRRELGFRASRKVMADADQVRLEAIFDELGEGGYRLFENGEALASFLARLASQG